MSSRSFHNQCITKNIVYIKENIASVDRILDLLLQNDVINMFEREDIVAKMPGERVHTMIDLVLKRKAQQAFLDALKQTGQNLIVEQIMSTQKEFGGFGKENKAYMEPKPHTISLLSPKIASFAPFHRERTSLWSKEHSERRSHDEANQRRIENLMALKHENEDKIRKLEKEMEKSKKEKKKYKQLEIEYKELTKENDKLKIQVDDLKHKLEARDQMLRSARKTREGEDEVDAPIKKDEVSFTDLKKSQENFENRLMKEMSKGQQQLLKVVESLTQKNVEQERKLAEATEKLDIATARLTAAADRLDSPETRSTARTSSTMQSSETILPPIMRIGKARQNSFIDGVALQGKLKN